MNAQNADINGDIDYFPIPNKKLLSVKDAIFDLEKEEQSKIINHEWQPVLKSHKAYHYMIKVKQGGKCGFVYRLRYNLPSRTILTSGPSLCQTWFCHPTLNRPISIREALRIQSFPDSFKVIGTLKDQAQVVGNAVPPLFMKVIAQRIMNTLKELGVTKQQYTVISLFAGCGGSSLGYKLSGFKELLAIDFNKNAIETFKLNFPKISIWQRDITQIMGTDILNFCNIKRGELDVLDGSPPCQGFSLAGKRQVCDIRNDLVSHYIRLVDEVYPKVFVMENVTGIIQGKMKGLFKEYMLKMKAMDYEVKCKLMNTKYYNVPQSRKRLIWIGIRRDILRKRVYEVKTI